MRLSRITALVGISCLLTACHLEPVYHPEAPQAAQSAASVAPESQPMSTEYGTEIRSLAKEPVQFSTGNLPVRMYRQEQSSHEMFEYLVEEADSCGPKRPQGYYQALQTTYQDVTQLEYTVEYTAEPYRGTTFTVTLLPNIAGYTTLEEFAEDFFSCGVGGVFPFMVDKNWLVFTTGCGGVNEGCGLVQETIQPSIRLR